MQITLYNTLTRSKDQFVAIDEENKKVKLYTCGPTVYGDPHIGNMRAYMFVDLLKSVLTHIWWYEVNSVMNITDVWHLTDDGDQWEDKMEKGAKRENKTVWQVARMYEENFKKYSNELQITPPATYTRATEYMMQQIQMVQTLTKKWFTYIIPGDGVYMDTSKVDDYGKLAQLDFEGMNSDHRVDGAKIDSNKKNNLSDFALWKYSREWEDRSMERVYTWDRAWYMIVQDDFDLERFVSQSDYQWDLQVVKKSQLTEQELLSHGFPGWHIECSAMASELLGDHIDIHTGWVDHISVHHTNEIAQAECSLWFTKWVNRWMHGQFLQIWGSKVSKSKWDDLSVAGIIAKGYDPLDLRYFYFTGHYRSFLDFTREAMDAAKSSRENLIKKINKSLKWDKILQTWDLYNKISTLLADDLDIVSAFSEINSVLATPSEQDIHDILRLDDDVFKLWLKQWVKSLLQKSQQQAPKDIEDLAQQRIQAKSNKNYELADSLRDKISDAGWIVKDTAGGFELEMI